MGVKEPSALVPQLVAAWFDAARRGDEPALRQLLGAVPVDLTNEQGTSALHYAAGPSGGMPSLMQFLVASGANVNLRDRWYTDVVTMAYGGASSALEHGEAMAIEKIVRDAGFAERPEDAPHGLPNVRMISETLDGAPEAAIESATRLVCANALGHWERAVTSERLLSSRAHAVDLPALTVLGPLPGRALALANETAPSLAQDSRELLALMEPLANAIVRRSSSVLQGPRWSFLALFNRLRRRAGVTGAPSSALILSQALASYPDRSQWHVHWADVKTIIAG